MVCTIVNKIAGKTLFAPSLQREDFDPLPKAILSALLVLHANSWTLAMMMSLVHRQLFKVRAYTDGKGKVELITLGAMVSFRRVLKSTIQHFEPSPLPAFDSNTCGLVHAIGFFRIWIRSATAYLMLTEAFFFNALAKECKDLATACQAAAPRWESCVTADSINYPLAKETVVDHPKRAEVFLAVR